MFFDLFVRVYVRFCQAFSSGKERYLLSRSYEVEGGRYWVSCVVRKKQPFVLRTCGDPGQPPGYPSFEHVLVQRPYGTPCFDVSNQVTWGTHAGCFAEIREAGQGIEGKSGDERGVRGRSWGGLCWNALLLIEVRVFCLRPSVGCCRGVAGLSSAAWTRAGGGRTVSWTDSLRTVGGPCCTL